VVSSASCSGHGARGAGWVDAYRVQPRRSLVAWWGGGAARRVPVQSRVSYRVQERVAQRVVRHVPLSVNSAHATWLALLTAHGGGLHRAAVMSKL
jgi:hypothetical protein